VLGRGKRDVALVGKAGRDRRGPSRALPSDDDRHSRNLSGLGQAGIGHDLVVRACEGVTVILRCRPHPRNDLELFLEAIEPPTDRGRERDAEGPVFLLEPARAEPELDPAATHGVHLSDDNGELRREPERRRAQQGAQADPARVTSQAGERDPRVCRARPRVASPIRR